MLCSIEKPFGSSYDVPCNHSMIIEVDGTLKGVFTCGVLYVDRLTVMFGNVSLVICRLPATAWWRQADDLLDTPRQLPRLWQLVVDGLCATYDLLQVDLHWQIIDMLDKQVKVRSFCNDAVGNLTVMYILDNPQVGDWGYLSSTKPQIV